MDEEILVDWVMWRTRSALVYEREAVDGPPKLERWQLFPGPGRWPVAGSLPAARSRQEYLLAKGVTAWPRSAGCSRPRSTDQRRPEFRSVQKQTSATSCVATMKTSADLTLWS